MWFRDTVNSYGDEWESIDVIIILLLFITFIIRLECGKWSKYIGDSIYHVGVFCVCVSTDPIRNIYAIHWKRVLSTKYSNTKSKHIQQWLIEIFNEDLFDLLAICEIAKKQIATIFG